MKPYSARRSPGYTAQAWVGVPPHDPPLLKPTVYSLQRFLRVPLALPVRGWRSGRLIARRRIQRCVSSLRAAGFLSERATLMGDAMQPRTWFCVSCALLICGVSYGCNRTAKSSRVIKHARVALDGGGQGVGVEFVFTNADMIRELIVEPIAAAPVDEAYASLALVGTIELTDDQGHVDRILLGLPWGRVGTQNDTRTADFGMLRAEIKEAYRRADWHLSLKDE